MIQIFFLLNFMKDLLKNYTNVSREPSQNLDYIKNEILTTKSVINETSDQIEKKADSLEEKQKQVYGQTKEIEDKMRLLETRDKMLELSINRNLYKKKVIYSLFSVILAFVIIMICFYAFFNKKMVVGE
jgi:hypothetical protein